MKQPEKGSHALLDRILSRPIGWPAAALAYLASAFAIIRLAEMSAGMAAFWPANAILIYALLVNPTRNHARLFAATAVASVLANLLGGHGLRDALVATVGNLCEAAIVIRLLAWLGLRRGRLLQPAGLARLPIAAAVASALSATIAMMGQTDRVGHMWLSWFWSDLLGIVLVVPTLLALFSRRRRSNREARPLRIVASGLAVFGAVAASAAGALLFIPAPLIFFCVLPVNFAVFRFGARGAVVATLTIAALSIAATLNGHGPFAAYTANPVTQIYLLQAFLVALLLAGLPLAALEARQARAIVRLVELERTRRAAAEDRQRSLEVVARKATLANSRDALTGVMTRVRISSKLQTLLKAQARNGGRLSVAILDVDHFKAINDTYGHDIGDEVLSALGQLALHAFRAPNAVGRLGGEEFLIILNGIDGDNAVAMVELFRDLVSTQGEVLLPRAISVSAGVASAQPGMDSAVLLKQADQALLAAKRQGRNRTLLAA